MRMEGDMMKVRTLFHIYIAAPFFNEKQLNMVRGIEDLLHDRADLIRGSVPFTIDRLTPTYFSPRLGNHALEMNATISRGEKPSQASKAAVFKDNVEHLQIADLVIAVIDDRDTGTIWEMGYFAGHHGLRDPDRPIVITVTGNDYGMNLMLALSIDAHCKGLPRLKEALDILLEPGSLGATQRMEFIRGTLRKDFLRDVDLLEGPAERS